MGYDLKPKKVIKVDPRGIPGASTFGDPFDVLGYTKSPISPKSSGGIGKLVSYGDGNYPDTQRVSVTVNPKTTDDSRIQDEDVDYEGPGLFGVPVSPEGGYDFGIREGDDRPFFDTLTKDQIERMLDEEGFPDRLEQELNNSL